MSHDDGTSSDSSDRAWLDDLFVDFAERNIARDPDPGPQPPLTPYAQDDFTAPEIAAPLVPIVDDTPTGVIPTALLQTDDESPTTVIPIVPRGTSELSSEQSDLLQRLRSRGTEAPQRAAEPRPAAGADRPQRAAGRKPSRRRRVLVRAVVCALAFSLTLVLTAVGVAGALYEKYNGQLHRVAVLQKHDPNIRDAPRQLHAENFLVIGSDSRAGLGGHFGDVSGARSDTTMIVHLSPSHTQATIISIPRDSWVTIPSCKSSNGSTVAQHQDMFNSAFTIGGPSCTIATVQKLTGIAVTHFVEIDFMGFEAMVQAMGSVTICSPQVVNDPGSGLKLHTGNNKLNGKQALAYVRARETLGDGSDLGRIKRQQMFMGVVLRKAMDGSMLSNPARLTSFLDAATKAITIDKDTTFGDLRTLATSLQGLNTKRVTFYTAPIANANYTPPGTSMTGRVLLDASQGRALYDSVIQDRKPVWVTDKNGKTSIVDSADGATTTAPTKSPALPKPNLNAAQKTCSL
ncbi:MAG: LCP family protein [Jatrophihabitantaceae bacterium]